MLTVEVVGTAGTVWVFGVVLVTVEVIDSEVPVKWSLPCSRLKRFRGAEVVARI